MDEGGRRKQAVARGDGIDGVDPTPGVSGARPGGRRPQPHASEAERSRYDRPMPDALHFTGDAEADALIAKDPLALLIGFALDQQITVQAAFAGPLKLRQRLGSLDAATIATSDPAELEALFRQQPAIHRFPGSMAKRVHDLAQHVADEYDGHAERVWTEAKDATDLEKRIRALPGFGDMKVLALSAVLAKRFGVEVAKPLAPTFPTLGDVDSVEALHEYQAAKRAYKKARREQLSSA